MKADSVRTILYALGAKDGKLLWKVQTQGYVHGTPAVVDGIAYIAQPGGKPPVSFMLVESKRGRVVFANPQHDFPQRIIYRLEADGSLFARVEATVKGQTRGIDYPYKRAKCE